MPGQDQNEDEENAWKAPEPEEDNRFSQEDDDRAGRAWHGMNSDYKVEQSGRFDSDDDEEDEAHKRESS